MQRTYKYKYLGQQSLLYADKNTKEHVCTMGREPYINKACVVKGTRVRHESSATQRAHSARSSEQVNKQG